MNKRRGIPMEHKLIERINKFEQSLVNPSTRYLPTNQNDHSCSPDSTFQDEDSDFYSSIALSIRSLGIDTTSYESIMNFRNTSYMRSKEDDYFQSEVRSMTL